MFVFTRLLQQVVGVCVVQRQLVDLVAHLRREVQEGGHAALQTRISGMSSAREVRISPAV